MADAATDVRIIADELGLATFSVVGRSGGAPHALACAALLDGRVQSAAALVGLAPPDAEGLNWYAGMADSNTAEFGRAEADPRAIAATLQERARQIRDDPESLLKLLEPELTRQDRRVVDEVAIQRLLTETYAEAFRRGAQGWIDDTLALRRPWMFDLAKINVPVLIWHGQDDVFSPVSHARWLADHIQSGRADARVEVVLKHDAAHFDAVEILPDILTWLKDIGGSERLRVEGAHQPPFAAQCPDARVVFTDQGRELVDGRLSLHGSHNVATLLPGEQEVGAAAQRVRMTSAEDTRQRFGGTGL